jgi:RimJ/RimL family protein N-acetyltransferase
MKNPTIPLHHVFDFTDVDRRFWEEHIEDWLPESIFDAHVHLTAPGSELHRVTEEMRREIWVNEVASPIDAPTTRHCIETVYPGRRVSCLVFGSPRLSLDLEKQNAYVQAKAPEYGWRGLSLLRPEWSSVRVAEELDKPGIIGVKPYYALIGFDPATRDKYIEASIFDFLPHHALAVLNDRRAWVTLHVPKVNRLGDPANIAEIKEIRRRYPDVILIVAHLGRCYTMPHAAEALPQFADDPGVHFDISAVLNPDVLRFAFETVGPERLLYGTDGPIFYMRGRRTWQGRSYINHTSYDFHFNHGRHESVATEAGYTLFLYEALRAIRQVCDELSIERSEVEGIFSANAQRLLQRFSNRRASKWEKKEVGLLMLWPKDRLHTPPVPVLPDDYALRQYADADENAYIALTHKAGFDWGVDRFHSMLPKIIPAGLFVIEHKPTGSLVATSFCKHNPIPGHPFAGELGWVAGDPDHSGKGLGMAVCAAVTARFIQVGYQDIYIRTQDWRLPAIKVYLKLGYEPQIDCEAMAEVWKTIFRQLKWNPKRSFS